MTQQPISRRCAYRVVALALLPLLLAGCASHPAPPEWQSNAQSALKSFSATYLRGDTHHAEQDFAHAREQIASTGRADLIARAELVRCATRVASLEFDGCAGYAPFAADASDAERSYAAYLTGHWNRLNAALLPPQHRAIVQIAPGADAVSLLSSMDDPLARLVAAGSLLQAGRLSPSVYLIATDTASSQGWRRPLLAWLGVRLQQAQQRGDAATAAALQRRIALVAPASR